MRQPYGDYPNRKKCACGTHISAAAWNSGWKPTECGRCVRVKRELSVKEQV